MKPAYRSKTIWLALVQAILMTWETPVQRLVKENPSLMAWGLCFAMVYLRIITTQQIGKK